VASELFEFAAEQLEKSTSLDRLQARGTLRIALKEAGLEPENLTLGQLKVVFKRILPGELETRGVRDAAGTCEAVLLQVASAPQAVSQEPSGGVDEIFRRLGRD